MISYELAKKLKDAGFPQNGPGKFEFGCRLPREAMTLKHGFGSNCDCLVKFPTLSELIEGCGDDFGSLDMRFITPKTWHASEHYMPTEPLGRGDTPEEAVANLWLALNNK